MRRPSRPRLRVLAAAALAMCTGGCGDDAPGVAITEADPVASRRPAALDTSVVADSMRSDSLLADSLLADTVEAVVADTVEAAPDFDAFWLAFQAAVRSGNVNAVARYATIGEDGIGFADLDRAYIKAFTEPFKSAVLGLSTRDFRRDETARDVRVVVGFDADGRVVPEDAADRDEAIELRFEVVEGQYRWVGFDADA